MIPEMLTVITKIQSIHKKKNEDYTSEPGKYYENFDRAAVLLSWFKHDHDKAYVNHIGTKLARLGSLLSSEREPNNESIEDTFLDLCTYCCLWYANYLYRNFRNKVYTHTDEVRADTLKI